MATKLRQLLTLYKPRALLHPKLKLQTRTRNFSACSCYRTDGVYQELTAMRTRTPFIEAFRKQQDEKNKKVHVPAEQMHRDLMPRTMADSYHRVVSHVI